MLAGGGSAAISTTATFNVHDGRSQALGLIALGFGRTQTPLFNGFLWTLPVATFGVQLHGSTASVFLERGGGYLHWTFAIPANPALVNTATDWQAFLVDPAAASGITMTNGVELVVR